MVIGYRSRQYLSACAVREMQVDAGAEIHQQTGGWVAAIRLASV